MDPASSEYSVSFIWQQSLDLEIGHYGKELTSIDQKFKRGEISEAAAKESSSSICSSVLILISLSGAQASNVSIPSVLPPVSPPLWWRGRLSWDIPIPGTTQKGEISIPIGVYLHNAQNAEKILQISTESWPQVWKIEDLPMPMELIGLTMTAKPIEVIIGLLEDPSSAVSGGIMNQAIFAKFQQLLCRLVRAIDGASMHSGEDRTDTNI
ncbi:hypothetical protein PTTG_27368 [Puccinia triticina 1-1 BBBD Race 1]|uniref:Uncharacterized protein n=1 Tax=Puccinia triticina (isolate 1-1 / race 1 (BBBD)) TaxID=630390 RepID=A0A180GLS2_PUCT1|nr:hypothetical protein PTTG_27368 [Puccinia triticina 1-1 BBBD Race 1]WAR60812.1 hypothetical protein PtB15_13B58 [Puccinia triticina]